MKRSSCLATLAPWAPGSRHARVGLAVGVVLSLLLIPGTGRAFHDPAPLLDERTIEGPFWFAWRVRIDAPGTTSSLEIEPTSENAQQVAYGLYLLRASDRERESFFIGTGDVPLVEAHVDDDEQGVDEQVGPVGGLTGPTNGHASTYTDLQPDDYWFVVVNTAPWADVATIRLFGNEGVSLLSTNQGTEGGLQRETDFDSPHNIQVRAGAASAQAHVGEIRDGTIEVEVEHRLFGIYQSLGADPNDVSYVAPDGTETEGRSTYVLMDRPPGTYTFKANEWRAIKAGFGSQGYIALLTADVDLPEAPPV